MAEKYEQNKRELEDLLDRMGLSELLACLSEICHEKAAHVRETWQDKPLSKTWNKAGDKVYQVSTLDTITQVP